MSNYCKVCKRDIDGVWSIHCDAHYVYGYHTPIPDFSKSKTVEVET